MSASCQRCGEPLAGTLLDGLCPRCVAAATFSDETGAEQSGSSDYELVSELGRGGMGVVYLARQRSLDRLVALKMLTRGATAGPGAEERFLREAREAARLRHPHIVAIHEVGRHDGEPFYSMDLIEGEELDTYVARHPLNAREAASLVAKIARAVQHAHEHGILHRDLKPGNLLVDAAGEPHLTDFGLVVALDGTGGLTRTGEIVGSPGYMAPEQLRGESTVASDVYGLGATLYFLLTGRPPFVAAQLPELLASLASDDALPVRRLDPSIPRDLDTITMRALAHDPSSRYASAGTFADDLGRWLDGRAIQARPVGLVGRAWSWSRRNLALATVAGALIVSLLAGVAGITSQWLRAERAATETALHLYSADLKVASDALLAGDLGLARQTLEACPPALHDTAWGLLWPLAAGDAETELGGGRWTVTHLAVSPDGKKAASTAQHDEIRLWDLDTTQPIMELPNATLSWWAAFAPDGRSLFTADTRVREWNLADQTVVREFPGQSGALAPDGATLYTCHGHRFVFEGEPGVVSAWDLIGGGKKFELPVPARAIALSRDGTRLAVSDAARWIALYDAADGRLITPPWPSLDRLWHLEFSPDGSQLMGSGWSKSVRIWSLDANPANHRAGGGEAPAPAIGPPRLLEHPLFTWEAAFSPDGRTLAVACSDRQVYLWDTQTWQRTRVLRGHHNEVWSVAWQPDGRLLSAGRDPRVLRWRTDQAPAQNWLRHDGDSYRIVWLPDGRIASLQQRDGGSPATVVATVRHPGGEVVLADETPLAFDQRLGRLWLWSDENELRARSLANLDDVIHIPWPLEPGESFLDYPYVVPTAGLGWAALADGSLIVHRLADGRRVSRHRDLAINRPWAAAMSPDGKRFVWGGLSTELFYLNLETGERKSLEGHYYDVATVAFTPDGTTFLTGGADGLLLGWATATGQPLWQLGTHPTSVAIIEVSPDNRVALSLEEGVGIHVWHLATRREVAFLENKDEGTDQWIGLSPDARWLALRRNNGELRIFPVAAAKEEHPTSRRVLIGSRLGGGGTAR